MYLAKVAIAGGLSALVLSACGNTAKPVAGTIPPTATSAGRALVDDPRMKHVTCLVQHKIPVTEVGRTWLQVGSAPAGPLVNFEPTPGAAQEQQISGQAQGAEVIGSALLYPKSGSDKLLQVIESCLAEGVKG
jgi:hypothetical protein